MSADFYQKLERFSDFSLITDSEQFAEVPSDWSVIITDVEGSTKAIEEGRYKDVNTIGVAVIAAVKNKLGDFQFPYVFGGDGATLLLPKQKLHDVEEALSSLKTLSEKNFDLKLRVGAISMSEITNLGSKVLVAKYGVKKGQTISIFKGGGLTVAESEIKSNIEKYGVDIEANEEANLEGLSCRWKPIPSKNGKVLTLLVQASSEDHEATYLQVLDIIHEQVGGELGNANPVNLDNMKYKSVWESIRSESRQYDNPYSVEFFKKIIEIIFAVCIFKWKLPNPFFNTEAYKQSLKPHSDYHKFDDMLRMILDCTHDQIEALSSYLEGLYQKKQIYYGVHTSDNSLMTCFVQSIVEDEHIHFIDGGDGGYAMAAKQLKKQMKDDQLALEHA